MERSSTAARIITALIGLVVAPIAMGFISTGGSALYRSLGMTLQPMDVRVFISGVLPVLFGMLLIAAVVWTARWSSAGLLTVGALAVLLLISAMFPAVILELYTTLRQVIPMEAMDGLVYGGPLLTFTVMGAIGVVAFRRRRSSVVPDPSRALISLIAAPVLLAIGGALSGGGAASVVQESFRYYDFTVQPLTIGALLLGAAATVAGVVIGGWSRWSLLLPGVVLIVLTLIVFAGPQAIYSALPMDVAMRYMPLFYMGIGLAAGAAMIASVVLPATGTGRPRFVAPVPGEMNAPYGGQLNPLNPYGGAAPPAAPPAPPQE